MAENIVTPMSLVTSTPQEAADNIDKSNVFQIGADVFKSNKEYLQPEVDKLARPTEAEPEVARYVAQTPEHAALASPDVDKLSWAERQWKLVGDLVGNRRTVEDQLNELNFRKVTEPDKITTDDELKIAQLNDEASKFTNYGLSPNEQIPAQVIGSLAQMGSAVGKHAELIAGATALGAGAGFLAAGPVGALAVGGETLGAGIGSAIVLDGAKSTIGSTYNQLSNMKDNNGQPIDEATKRNVSLGMGVASSVLTIGTGKLLSKTFPAIANLMGPEAAKTIVLDPAKAALKDVMLKFGEAVGGAYAMGAAQKVVEITGMELAKGFDGSPESVMNSLLTAGEEIKKQTGEINRSGVISSLSVAPLAALGSFGSYKGTKASFIAEENANVNAARDITPEPLKQIQAPGTPKATDIVPTPNDGGGSPVDRSIKILQFDQALDQIKKVTDTTEMKKLAPNELSQLHKNMMDAADVKSVFLDKEELSQFASNPTKADAVRNIIDPKGVAAAGINAPIEVPAHKFMELVEKYPDASELARLSPDGPSVTQAQKFLEAHVKAGEQRQQILQELGAADITPEQKAKLEQDLQSIETFKPTDVFGEEEYLKQPTFTDAIAKTLGKSEVTKFNDAQMSARQSVVDHINESAKYEMDQVRDINLEQAREAEFQSQLTRLENNPNLEIVDRFKTNPQGEEFLTEMTKNHAKKGYSPFAIDPKSLPEELKPLLKNEQLKQHKVFVKGGIDYNEAASWVGVKDGETLLKLLASTPDRESIARLRTNLRDADLQAQVNESVPLNDVALMKAYKDNTANHIAEMKFMREQEWPATKAGIKRIALPLPKVEELANKAHQIVSQTPVGNLNVNQYKVGERKSQRVAVNSILKNEVEKAFVAKESAALNSELTRETQLAIGKVNRVIKIAKKFQKADVIQELSDAGKLYSEAAKEILDVFNLNPKSKGSSDAGSFAKWAMRMYHQGNGNFEIPERLSDVRKSINDMTVEQTLLVGDRLQSILEQARLKNKLLNKFEDLKIAQTEEAVALELHSAAIDHPFYNEKAVSVANVQKPLPQGVLETVFDIGSGFQNLLSNFEFNLLQLDQEKLNGPFHKYIARPLLGSGEFNGKAGESGETNDLIAFRKNHEELITKFYDLKKYMQIENDVRTIPEFKDLPGLRNGRLTKGDLMVLWVHGGDPGGLVNREKFGVSNEVIQKVLDRELTEQDCAFMQQALPDSLNSYKERTAALQKASGAKDVNFIEGVPNKWRDKVFPGGYVPQAHVNDLTQSAIKQYFEYVKDKNATIFGGKEGEYFARQYAAEMTDQGRLKDRVGSDKFLDLSFNRVFQSHKEIINDLNFRLPVRDTLKILRNPIVKSDIIKIIGEYKYNTLVNTAIEAAGRIEAENKNYFADSNSLMKNIIGSLNGGFSVTVLALNFVSTAVQFASVPYALGRAGFVPALKHVMLTLVKMRNPLMWNHFVDFAAQINPDLRKGLANIDDHFAHAIDDLQPERNKYPKLALLARGKEIAMTKAMKPMAMVDTLQKVVFALSTYSQFIAGDAENAPLSKIQKMSPQELHDNAIAFARQHAATSLTKSTIFHQIACSKITDVWKFRKVSTMTREITTIMYYLLVAKLLDTARKQIKLLEKVTKVYSEKMVVMKKLN
jgi:hypothetical protein